MKKAKLQLITILMLVMGVMAGAAFAAQNSGKMKVQIPPAPELYATAPQPLTANQCGQCHPSLFGNIRDNGAKHRFDCQKCHSVIHAYSPRKNNYDEVMPKCGTCHEQPHGAKITACSTCHTNPHTPKAVAMNATLMNACSQCHSGPQEQLLKFKSKHTKLACSKCHTAHGLKPSCFNCHKPHHAGQEVTTCNKCHSVHSPLQVTYTKDSPAVTCGSCHTKVFAKWQKTESKHAKVNCAFCHRDKHRFIPQCRECHPTPHPEGIIGKFPKCLSCHLDVHDLPVRPKKK